MLLQIGVLVVTLLIVAGLFVTYGKQSDAVKVYQTEDKLKTRIEDVCGGKYTAAGIPIVCPAKTAIGAFSCHELVGMSNVGPVGGVTADVSGCPAGDKNRCKVSGWKDMLIDCIVKSTKPTFSDQEMKRNVRVMYLRKSSYMEVQKGYTIMMEPIPTYCILYNFTGNGFQGGLQQVAEVGVPKTGPQIVYLRLVAQEN